MWENQIFSNNIGNHVYCHMLHCALIAAVPTRARTREEPLYCIRVCKLAAFFIFVSMWTRCCFFL